MKRRGVSVHRRKVYQLRINREGENLSASVQGGTLINLFDLIQHDLVMLFTNEEKTTISAAYQPAVVSMSHTLLKEVEIEFKRDNLVIYVKRYKI